MSDSAHNEREAPSADMARSSYRQTLLQRAATETDPAKFAALPGRDGQKACGAHLAKRWDEGVSGLNPTTPHLLITQTDYFIKMLKYANADLVLGD